MTLAAAERKRRLSDRTKVIGLVSSGHFLAHFYVIVLPPLFPLLQREFGVSYSALGLLLTVSSVTTGLVQVPVGFLVDRFGPRLLLLTGLGCMSAAVILSGLTSSYSALLAMMLLLGGGNSVFHPADYSILSARVEHTVLGRAFSLHTFSGHLGWAIAPTIMITLTALWGWRPALVAVGLCGLLVLGAILLFGRVLETGSSSGGSGGQPDPSMKAEKDAGGNHRNIRLLFTAPMLLLFCYMIMASVAAIGLNSFTVVALVDLYDTSLDSANLVLTVFLSCSAGGVLLGGLIADRTKRHDLVIVAGFCIAAAALVLVGSSWLPILAVSASIALAGLMNGAIRPSRDIMVRAAAPAGSVGKVFGFVTSGMNVGGAIAPLLFGWILDQGQTPWIFYAAAGAMLLALLAALLARPKAI
ncbi:MFS transporter [Denitrobaculum tricleocarpae]|uniref:MFS transporter n=1 Tax=Denitrobaculum tricleocarpae TaxID=2591009 RepID=A0A545TXH6_9PROT|nr:MFS transporter [Denitrobaculum tricleocarpae]TQV81884.1 MFS transporter [Denitrobaculum tricleocarpae]